MHVLREMKIPRLCVVRFVYYEKWRQMFLLRVRQSDVLIVVRELIQDNVDICKIEAIIKCVFFLFVCFTLFLYSCWLSSFRSTADGDQFCIHADNTFPHAHIPEHPLHLWKCISSSLSNHALDTICHSFPGIEVREPKMKVLVRRTHGTWRSLIWYKPC